jgi:hypothetical protein
MYWWAMAFNPVRGLEGQPMMVYSIPISRN